MRELHQLRKEVSKLKTKADDGAIRYRMKDGSIVTLTRKDAKDEAYMGWVENNADPTCRDTTGSKCHALTQMVNNTTNEPFESWEAYKQRGGDLLVDEFAEAVETDG